VFLFKHTPNPPNQRPAPQGPCLSATRQVPFQTHHPENQGIFHKPIAKPLCKGGFNSPLHNGFTHIIEKIEIYLQQKIPHLSAARQNPKKIQSPIR
jgi:hypothetical protein